MNVINLKNTAERLIRENGFEVLINSIEKGEFNPETGEYDTSSIQFTSNAIYSDIQISIAAVLLH